MHYELDYDSNNLPEFRVRMIDGDEQYVYAHDFNFDITGDWLVFRVEDDIEVASFRADHVVSIINKGRVQLEDEEETSCEDCECPGEPGTNGSTTNNFFQVYFTDEQVPLTVKADSYEKTPDGWFFYIEKASHDEDGMKTVIKENVISFTLDEVLRVEG